VDFRKPVEDEVIMSPWYLDQIFVAVINSLTSKTVECLSLALESIDNVHGCDGLMPSMLSVGDRITDEVLKEDLEHTAGLLVDEDRDTLDTATTSKMAYGRLGDALDVNA
jgi:hypothetical protein